MLQVHKIDTRQGTSILESEGLQCSRELLVEINPAFTGDRLSVRTGFRGWNTSICDVVELGSTPEVVGLLESIPGCKEAGTIADKAGWAVHEPNGGRLVIEILGRHELLL